jgi:hypothetical protein
MVFLRAAAWFGVLVLSASQAFPQAPFAFSCGEDAHIDTAKKKTIDAVAMDFVRTVLGPSPSAAFDFMSKAGQAENTRQQLDGAAAAIIRQFEPKNVTLQHTYFIELKGKSPGRVVCATDLSKPDGWESLAADSIPEQAHVLLSADTRNNKLAFGRMASSGTERLESPEFPLECLDSCRQGFHPAMATSTRTTSSGTQF